MLLTDVEVTERMESPLNLLNRLRNLTSQKNSHPSIPPSSDELVKDLQEKIEENSVKVKARSILIKAMNQLDEKIETVEKPEQLSRIADTMSKVINSQSEKKSDGPDKPQIIIYAPQFKQESHYETVMALE